MEWHFPTATHSLDALLRDQWVTGDYWERHSARKPKETPPRIRARVARLTQEELGTTEPWRTLRDAIADLPKPRSDREHPEVLNHRLQPGARVYPGHTGSALDLPSKTLKAGVHGVPGGENAVLLPTGEVRYLTVREAARVQTFPDRWHFRGAWSEAMRQLGNAVPKQLAETVARAQETRTAVPAGRLPPEKRSRHGWFTTSGAP